MKKLIALIKKLLGIKPKPTPQPTQIPTPDPTPRPKFNYVVKSCETGAEMIVTITKQLNEGSAFFISGQEDSGCYVVMGPSSEFGKPISYQVRQFLGCDECLNA